MKKILILALILFVTSITPTYATTNLNTGVSDTDTTQELSQSEINKKIEETVQNMNDLKNITDINSNIRAVYNDVSYSIYVANYTQEKTYWCGPAAAKQALSFHKAYNQLTIGLPSQSTLASQLGTTTSGTSSSSLANVLNQYKTTYNLKQNYVATDVLDKADPDGFLASALKTQIVNCYTAPIILIETGTDTGISNYKGVYLRHYNTIKGVVIRQNLSSGTTSVYTVTRVDPHYDSKYRGTYTDSFYRIYNDVSAADRTGTNKVLVY